MNTGRKRFCLKRSSEAVFVLLLFAGIVLSRLYLFDIYKVPSSSMCPALLPGDYIFVSKTAYGPRVVNIFRLLFRHRLEYKWHRHTKMPELYDVIVFNHPQYGSGHSDFSITLGAVTVKRISGLPGDSVSIDRAGTERAYANVFPFDTALHWRVDRYGPLYVPRKNDTLYLTELNLRHYESVVRMENLVRAGDSTLSIDQQICHVFALDYYFVTGDNFYSSSDSRHWGFVPETHIIGKVTRILFSYDKTSAWQHRVRWKRILNKVQ